MKRSMHDGDRRRARRAARARRLPRRHGAHERRRPAARARPGRARRRRRGRRPRPAARRRYRLHVGGERHTLGPGTTGGDEGAAMSAFTDLIGKELGPTEWFEVTPGADRRVRGGDRRPAVDPHRPGARGGGPVRDDGRARLPDAVALRAADDADARADAATRMGINYGVNKVRFPAPVPSGLADPRAVHRAVGRRGARAASRRSCSRRSSARAATSRSASPSSCREDATDEPLRGAGRRSSRAARKGIGAATAARLAAEGARRRRRRLRRGRRGGDRASGSAGARCAATSPRGRTSRRRSPRPPSQRAARHPRHLRRDHPRQPRPQDDRRRLGGGDRHPPARHVPRRAGGAGA